MLTGLLVGSLPVDCVAVCLLSSSDKDVSAVGKPYNVCKGVRTCLLLHCMTHCRNHLARSTLCCCGRYDESSNKP